MTRASIAPILLVAAALVLPSAASAASVKLAATLTGANEPAGGAMAGGGGFTVETDPETNDFCYKLWVDKAIKPTMAHVHSGEAGSNGPVVVALEVTGQKDDMCIAVDKAKLDPIVAKPEAFYVNVHTAELPAGAIRGQLAKQ